MTSTETEYTVVYPSQVLLVKYEITAVLSVGFQNG